MTPDLHVRWSKKQKDVMIKYPRSPDGHLAFGVLCSKRATPNFKLPFGVEWLPSFTDELEARGYDITTLKLSCMLKKPETPTPESPPSPRMNSLGGGPNL